MNRHYLKSPRAEVRIAAARRFLKGLGRSQPFLVVGPSRHPADRLVQGLAESRGRQAGTLGAFRFGFFILAEWLARPELRTRGLRRLTPATRLAAVVRVLYRAQQDGALGRFERVAEGPGLAARLAHTFSDLRLAGVPEDAVRKADRDLGNLFGDYLATLASSRLADRAELLLAAQRQIETNPRAPVGLPLVFLDVPLRDLASRRFAAALAAASIQVLWTFPEGDEASDAWFGSQGAAMLEAEQSERTGDAVDAAQQGLFGTRPPERRGNRRGLNVISAPGAAAEAIELTRIFLAEAATGVPFDRMAVLLAEPAGQASAFREALERAGVPAFFEAGTRRRHPAGRAFLILLDCALEGLSATRFAEFLSLGETPAPGLPAAGAGGTVHGVERAAGLVAPRRWEHLILDSEVIGGLDRWERRLAHFADRLRRDEEAEEDGPRREAIAVRREDLKRLTETALPILRRLAALPAPHARFSVWVDHLEELARAALLNPEGVLECLAETAPMGEVEGVSLREVRESLARRLDAVVSRSIGSRYGRVWVGPIEAARGLAFEVVAIPGLSERAFPRVIREDPMLLDRVRRRLSPELPLRSQLAARERLRLRIAVGAATRRLVLSYSSLNPVEGRRQVPSYYLAETFRAGLGRIPTLSEILAEAARDSQVVRGLRAPKDPAAAIDRREFDLAGVAAALDAMRSTALRSQSATFLLSDEALRRSLRQEFMRQHPRWQSADGFLRPDPAALASLEGYRPGNRSYSATGLEAYAACPYQFFLKNVVRLRPVERPEALVHLDPLTRGSLLHDVFFHVGRELRDRGLAPLTEESLGEAFSILEDAFWRAEEETRERVAPVFPGIWKDQMDGLLGDLRGFLQRYAGSGRIPVANEFTFGMGARQLADPDSRTEAAILPGGLQLHGAIDAVERLPDGRTEITDYKTGRAAIEPTGRQDVLFGGRALQPLLYALAYEALSGVPVTAGRLYYATIRGAYQEAVVNSADEAARETFEAFVALLDRAIAHGRFPALPNPAVSYRICDYCDYLPVCGPRPATHVTTKEGDRQSAALGEVAAVRRLP